MTIIYLWQLLKTGFNHTQVKCIMKKEQHSVKAGQLHIEHITNLHLSFPKVFRSWRDAN